MFSTTGSNRAEGQNSAAKGNNDHLVSWLWHKQQRSCYNYECIATKISIIILKIHYPSKKYPYYLFNI